MSILFPTIKFLLPLLAAICVWRLFRSNFVEWTIANLVRSIGGALAFAAAAAVMYGGREVIVNPVARLTAAAMIAIAVLLLYMLAARRARDLFAGRPSWPRLVLPRSLDQTLCVSTSIIIAVGLWLALGFVSRLQTTGIAEGDHNAPPAAIVQAGPTLAPDYSQAELAHMQHRFFTGLRRGIASSQQFVYESTGLDALLVQMQAFSQLQDLHDDELQWLLRNHDDILALIEHPLMNRVLYNERIAGLIDELSDGSISALYALGREPDIQALLEDPKLYALAQSLDLVVMMQQVEQYRAAQVNRRHE